MMTARRPPAIIELVSGGQINAVKKLIDQGCDINEKDYLGGCAVIAAVERNDLPMLELLISKGASLDVEDPLGDSALLRAKQLGHNEVAELIKTTLDHQKKTDNLSLQNSQSHSKVAPLDTLGIFSKNQDEECKQHTPIHSPANRFK